MKLGLDFDGVLFNTKLLKKKLEERYDCFMESYHENKKESVYNSIYDFRGQCKDMNVDSKEFLETVKDLSKDCLYDDVDKLNDIGLEKVIITRGKRDFQKAKIEGSGILDYVDDYRIVDGNYSKNFEDIDILIDDTLNELYGFKGKKIHFDREEADLELLIDTLESFKYITTV